MLARCDKYTLTKYLVIVESPAKCASIEKYLGDSYKCIASYGHLRTIKSLKDVDIANLHQCKVTYSMIEDSYKNSQINKLKEEIKKADEVLLATDDDREGESIAWHICDIFGLPLNTTKRIIFHEITEKALLYAVANPTFVNMNVVYAQQARQILDLIVGFTISPILWKTIQYNKDNALSAGRCQTPALQLVYDHFKIIQESKGRKVYNTIGTFTNMFLPFSLNKEFENSLDVEYFLENDANHDHLFQRAEPKIILKPPPLPFTTSRLQQTASNSLHYSPKETMKHCQSLYEKGLITYMRTDSSKYCDEFINSCNQYILKTYSDKYTSHITSYQKNDDAKENGTNENDLIELKKTEIKTKERKKTNATKTTKVTMSIEESVSVKPQEAHEAIRCTDIFLTPSIIGDLNKGLSPHESKLYNLIWTNSIESLMPNATFSSFISSISAFDSYFYKYTCEQNIFPGWLIVSGKDTLEKKQNEYSYLSAIKQGATVEYTKIESKQTILGTVPRYTESRLVSLLEEEGIGRPSTYASLIDKIQQRNYVKKEDIKGEMLTFTDFELEGDTLSEISRERLFGSEKNKLVLQPLGIIVSEFLKANFDALFNYDYTKQMESKLDLIANGSCDWVEVCKLCHKEVTELAAAVNDMNKLSYEIDEFNTYIIGKNGPVIKHVEDGVTSFLPVVKDIDLVKLQNKEYTIDDVVEKQAVNSICLGKYKGDDLFVKKGKYGIYLTYGENKRAMPMFGNRPIENIRFAEVFTILEEDGILKPSYKQDQKALKIVRELSASLSIRKGKWGNYIYYQTFQMQKPKFFDLKTFEKDTKAKVASCDINVLKNWIKTTHNVS